MANLDKAHAILEKALAEWRKQQTLRRGKISINRFADFLGYSQAAVGFWLNRDRNISEDALISILPKLAELLGMEIYEELEVPRPNPLYEYASAHWDELPLDEQKRITKIIGKYTSEPLPNGTETHQTAKP